MSSFLWGRNAGDDEEIKRLHGLIEQHFYQNPSVGLHYVHLLDEAARLQNNTRLQSYAKVKEVEYYYPMFDNDSIFNVARMAEEFTRQHEEYHYLFLIQYILVQRYINEGEFRLAREKTRAMFDELKEKGNDEDRALGVSALANLYKHLERYEEAIDYYRESLRLLRAAGGGSNLFLILENFRELALVHQRIERYDLTLLYADSMRVFITQADTGGLPNNSQSLFMAACFTVEAFSKRGELDEATAALATMERLYSADFPRSFRILYLQSLARYHRAKGAYEKAYALNEELLELVELLSTPNERPDILRRKADLLSSMGRPDEAIPVYEEAFERQIAYDHTRHNRQVNELRAIYELDKMETQTREDALRIRFTRNISLALGVIAILLGTILFLVIRQARRIRMKNRGLIRQINEQELLTAELATRDAEIQRLSPPPPPAATPGETMEELYLRIRLFMQENQPYIDPLFNWKTLIALLETNERLLRATLKKYLGVTVSEYITRQRLNYAKRLLAESDSTIEAIAFDAGFGSRNTFYRLFREHYGLTPDEYRKANRES
ncbi:AraC-like DNA-binding protein [Parabacteroides sp. PFB2-10]|uniref:helix-turn-helix domain-containing protein n=1 Tax=Parabacteroides sp. PFB2-10 TaxID=1742405 RepID=UPI00247431C2|nr:helix-turn-helix domain-containing protein [Parabacteroides sp. PFB2-10]MDH6311427.1 AraC-like DNA-binding protein [Parabacteroides sp. PFB2-10]